MWVCGRVVGGRAVAAEVVAQVGALGSTSVTVTAPRARGSHSARTYTEHTPSLLPPSHPCQHAQCVPRHSLHLGCCQPVCRDLCHHLCQCIQHRCSHIWLWLLAGCGHQWLPHEGHHLTCEGLCVCMVISDGSDSKHEGREGQGGGGGVWWWWREGQHVECTLGGVG